MIQISFQAAFDPFHAVFRMLRLSTLGLLDQQPREKIRILDFYLVFPHRLSAVRLNPQHQRLKKISEVVRVPYREQPDDKSLFERMHPMQTAAMETLGARGLISEPDLQRGVISATGSTLPSTLDERLSVRNAEQSELVAALVAIATGYELLGPNGLKARTGLLDHRYDAI